MAEEKNKAPASYCRDCAGFSPTVTALPQSNGEQVPYLPVSERILWFNQWCAEQSKQGRIETDVTVQALPGQPFPFAICEAKIYLDDKLAAADMVYRPIFVGQPDAAYYDNVVQKAVTAAKGRALANLGFNIPGGIEEEPERQSESAAKSPDSIPKAPTAPAAPATQVAPDAQANSEYLPARVGFGAEPELPREKAANAPTPGDKQTQMSEMTLEQANAVLVEYGRFKDQHFTVGQLLTMEACPDTQGKPGRQWLEFFAGYGPYAASGGAKLSGKMPTLYRASQIVLDAADGAK